MKLLCESLLLSVYAERDAVGETALEVSLLPGFVQVTLEMPRTETGRLVS